MRIQLALVVVLAFGSACKSPTKPTYVPQLHSATSLVDFATQIKNEYNYTFTVDGFDKGFAEYPAARNFFGSDDPVQGTYSSRPIINYPFENGRFLLGFKDPNRKTSLAMTGTTLATQGQGSYQAFWAIQDLRTNGSVSWVPIIILGEGIVSAGGVPKYRAVYSLYGNFVKQPFLAGSTLVQPQTTAIHGSFQIVSIETIDKEDTSLPCLYGGCAVSYETVWFRVGS